MGAPGSNGQIVLVLRNAWMSEAAVRDAPDPGPQHTCEGPVVCAPMRDCEVMRRWRARQNVTPEER